MPSDPSRQSVAVVGPGGIGGVVAAALAHAGRHEVVACARGARPPHLTLERPEGSVETVLATLTDPALADPVDWVLLCTKAQDSAAAGPWLHRLCDARTRVAVLQNGIGHADRVAPFIGAALAVPVIVYYNGERLAADRVRLRHAGPHDLAVMDGADGLAFRALLEGTLLDVLVTDAFPVLQWRKLLMNATANPVTALTLRRQAVMRRADVQALCLGVMAEAVAVARAEGVALADDEPERATARLLTYPPEAGTSMYFDRLAGRAFEVEALTGAIVAAADRHALPVPLNRALLTLLRATGQGDTAALSAPGPEPR